jgi:hypothetical protein
MLTLWWHLIQLTMKEVDAHTVHAVRRTRLQPNAPNVAISYADSMPLKQSTMNAYLVNETVTVNNASHHVVNLID